MVIGVLLSGVIFGLCATMGTLFMGAPVWLAVIAYPLVGSFGAIGFVGLALLRPQSARRNEVGDFAVRYNG